jgi:hypothetical protein
MTTREQVTGIARSARRHALRLVYCLFIFSFLLPYVDVLGCSSKKIETLHGYQLLKGNPAAFYLLTLVLFAAMLALTFYRKDVTRSLRAFGSSWRAVAAAVAGFIIWLLPGIQFLFDNVYMLVGQLLGLSCVVLVVIDAIAVSIREYVLLRKEALPPDGAKALPPALLKLHAAVLVLSLGLVPLYIYSLRDEIMLAVLYFLFLSLPFVLAQAIVFQGIRRGERWTLRLAPAVLLLAAGAAAITVLSFF